MWRNDTRTIGVFLLALLLCSHRGSTTPPIAVGSSTPEQALDYLLKTKLPDSSIYWPNIRRTLFVENLKANIRSPLALYQGTNTNFCGYAALSYLPLHEHCLFKLGVPLGEMWNLGELARWLRDKRRSAFLLTAPPLRLPGAVGSPSSPVATV